MGMPDFTITLEWLLLHSRNRNLTKDQVLALNEPWPLTSGWMDRLPGKVIPHWRKLQFERHLRVKQVRDSGGGSLDLL